MVIRVQFGPATRCVHQLQIAGIIPAARPTDAEYVLKIHRNGITAQAKAGTNRGLGHAVAPARRSKVFPAAPARGGRGGRLRVKTSHADHVASTAEAQEGSDSGLIGEPWGLVGDVPTAMIPWLTTVEVFADDKHTETCAVALGEFGNCFVAQV
jgi:hypothetical protein